jgi:hypothetical protein
MTATPKVGTEKGKRYTCEHGRSFAEACADCEMELRMDLACGNVTVEPKAAPAEAEPGFRVCDNCGTVGGCCYERGVDAGRAEMRDKLLNLRNLPFPYQEKNTSGPLSVRLVNTMRQVFGLVNYGHGWGNKENLALEAIQADMEAAGKATVALPLSPEVAPADGKGK